MDHDVIYELYDILLSFLDALVWCYKWREKMEGKKFCHLFHSILFSFVVLLFPTLQKLRHIKMPQNCVCL